MKIALVDIRAPKCGRHDRSLAAEHGVVILEQQWGSVPSHEVAASLSRAVQTPGKQTPPLTATRSRVQRG